MEEIKQFWLLVIGVFVVIFQDVGRKTFWSLAAYFGRGEFNDDNRESTPDKFLLLNPSTGTFQKCYITKYTLTGVQWGFYYEKDGLKGLILKKTFWLSWAGSRDNRFPMPIHIEKDDIQSMLEIIQRRR